jgi:membrane associated rhomboid family serine protease
MSRLGGRLTHVRIGESLFSLPDEQWEIWVRSGRIPPEAWIRSPVWTRGVWRQADSLEVYHLFLPSLKRVSQRRAPGLSDTIFARRGLSTTEILLLANLAVSALLLLIWTDRYSIRLWELSRSLKGIVGTGEGFPAVLIPMFLHASPQHLFRNMIALVASGSMTEYFYGRWKMLVVYLLSGFGGAAFSMFLRPKPLLSVGASGAIFGLYGLGLAFLLRHLRRFGRRQRWKTMRIYLPIMVLVLVPSIFGADLLAHVGGFVTGFAIGLFLPPGPRIVYLTDAETPEEEEDISRDEPIPID